MLSEAERHASSYTLLDGSTPRPVSANLPDQSPPSRRKDLGGPRPRPAQEKSEDWGNECARRAHNLPPIPARMSARSRRKIFQTYLCGDGRPGPGRRRAGLGCCRPVLARGTPSRSSRSASLTTRSAFRKEQKRVRTECTRPGVTRDRVWTPRGGRGTGRKRRTLQDHVLSPFGRL